MKKTIVKALIPLLIGLFIYLLPVPEGMNPKGWHLFAIFMGCIIGIVLEPFPVGIVALISMCIATLLGILDLTQEALAGYSSPVIWLVVYVFFIARGVIKSQLGERIAFLFVKFLGKHSLGLGYGVVSTDLILAPLIPSNSARAGGIIFPIAKAMSEALGSFPNCPTARKLGGFLVQVGFHCNLVTSAMFLTAMAANPMIQDIAFKTGGIQITWTNWCVGALVPGILSLILVPLMLYFVYPPQLKHLPGAVEIANERLKSLGPVKREEWMMIGTFAVMLILWIKGDAWGISPTTTALLGLAILLLTKVLTLDDILNEYDAWHTLLWYAIVVTMARFLQEFGFVSWFSGNIGVFFSDFHWHYAFLGLTLVYFYSHYFLASNTAHVGAMYGAFLMVALSVGTPPLLAALVLGYASNLFAHMTQYGSTSGVILFGAGYVPIVTWWKLGFLVSVLIVFIWGTAGMAWWKLLGWW